MCKEPKRHSFFIDEKHGEVSSLILAPKKPRAVLVLGHGSGSNMEAPLITGVSQALLAHEVATLRFQYPYSEAGKKVPNRAPVLLLTVRRALEEARRLFPDVPLFGGGHSMSSRMMTMAAAQGDTSGLEGLIALAFPLAAKGDERTVHFRELHHPVLFLHGTRDRLSPLEELKKWLSRCAGPNRLEVIETADHSFKVLKRTGITPDDVNARVASSIVNFISTPA